MNAGIQFQSTRSTLSRPICPRCNKPLRLCRMEPVLGRNAETSTFECDCGYTFKETVERTS